MPHQLAGGLPESSGTGTADRAEVRAAEVQFATDRQPRLSDSQGRCTGRSLDLCFITEGSLKPIIERWKRLGIPIAAGPAPRTGALGRMTSWAGEHESCQYPVWLHVRS